MESNIHGKDGQWENQVRTSTLCSGLGARGWRGGTAAFGEGAAVKAAGVSQLA